MKKHEIKAGGDYLAKVNGKVVTVRVDRIEEGTVARGKVTPCYYVTNLSTGRKTTFRSAAKFRGPAEGKHRPDPTAPAGPPGSTSDGPSSSTAEGEQGSDPTAPAPAGTTSPPSLLDDAAAAPAGRPAPQDRLAAKLASRPSTAPGSTAASPSLCECGGNFSEPDANDVCRQCGGLTRVAGYAPTPEQWAILRKAREPGLEVLVIAAGAGAGKTSTLKMLEEALPGRGQYTAFNTSLVAESKAKFRKARCNTTHSLAFGAVGKHYAHRLGGRRVRSDEVARMLGIEPLQLTVPDTEAGKDAEGNPVTKIKTLAPGYLASLVMGAIRKFCQSADGAVGTHHFKPILGIDAPDPETGRPSRANQRKVWAALLPYAAKAWADLSNPQGTLPFSHDGYVKVWQLGRGEDAPVIPCDYLLLDEAQDTAEVFLDVVRRQSALVVLVGDDNQQIYEWRGAVNAMASFPGAPRLLLPQSFRFGQAVADVANSILTTLEKPTDLVMRGLESIPSRVIQYDPPAAAGSDRARTGGPAELIAPRAVLCRTNAGAVGTVLSVFAAGKRPHLIGGGAEVVAFVKAAQDLQRGRPTQHPELCCFESWKEVQAYVKEDEGEDLKLLVKLIDEFKPEPILEALERMPEEAEADLVVSTAHKSKGREWPSVRLAGDFPPANRMDDAAVRLLYVAATRAQYVLDLSQCPPFLPGKDRDTGEEIPPIRVTYTKPVPSAEELAVYLAGKDKPQEAAEATPAAPAPPPADGEYTWAKWDHANWAVRGPKGVKPGTAVTVTKKNGQTSREVLGEEVRVFSDAALYRVRR